MCQGSVSLISLQCLDTLLPQVLKTRQTLPGPLCHLVTSTIFSKETALAVLVALDANSVLPTPDLQLSPGVQLLHLGSVYWSATEWDCVEPPLRGLQSLAFATCRPLDVLKSSLLVS